MLPGVVELNGEAVEDGISELGSNPGPVGEDDLTDAVQISRRKITGNLNDRFLAPATETEILCSDRDVPVSEDAGTVRKLVVIDRTRKLELVEVGKFDNLGSGAETRTRDLVVHVQGFREPRELFHGVEVLQPLLKHFHDRRFSRSSNCDTCLKIATKPTK